MTLDQIKSVLIQKKPALLTSGISEIGIFGSFIRVEQNENSDIDILIDLIRPSKLDLLQLISIEDELKEELGIPVDLVIKTSLKPNISKSVLFMRRATKCFPFPLIELWTDRVYGGRRNRSPS